MAPWFAKLKPREVLFWLVLPHAFRHIGMVFLVPGIVAETLPVGFSYPAAFGDLLAGLLALLALGALRGGCGTKALVFVWIFNVVGTVDLLYALSHADAIPGMGAAWYIPTFLVPLLLVTHFMIFTRLLKRGSYAKFENDESNSKQNTIGDTP